MRKLIKDGALAEDRWILLEEDAAQTPTDLPDSPVIVPLAFWLEHKAALASRLDTLGVWLNGDEDPAQLADDTASLPLIAVNFPGFMDGRGFSTGRLLRERYGFEGELRAVGQFIRDQLCYLRRCGFSAFSLTPETDPEGALASLNAFSEYYQAAVDQPIPLFRRRA